MGTLAYLSTEGDTKMIWTPGNVDEVDNARSTFNRLKAKGFSAFSVKKNGEKNELITEFDPDISSIIMVPRMVGG